MTSTAPAFAVVILGESADPLSVALANELIARAVTLASANERIEILRQGESRLPANTRTVAVMFCRGATTAAEDAAIEWCRRERLTIFPVVPDLKQFATLAPQVLSAYNGFQLKETADVGELAGLVLETLGLQRSKRKIFISYARQDSAEIAQQLHDALTGRWYRVFLDTVSIRPGAIFQEELRQELSDSDVMVLLNSPSVPNRPYVQDEIRFADQAGVGGLEVVWPGMPRRRDTGFFMPIELSSDPALTTAGMVTGTLRLTPKGLTQIVRTVADLRTEVQAQREEKVARFVHTHLGGQWQTVMYPGRFIALEQRGSQYVYLDLALGLPTSLDLQQACMAVRSPSPSTQVRRIIYDPLGVTDTQADHLAFLSDRLKIQLLDYRRTSTWMSTLP